MWLVSISQKVESWSCSERQGDAMGLPVWELGPQSAEPGSERGIALVAS